MNYIDYLQKRYSNYTSRELVLLQVQAKYMERSNNEGEKMMADSYQTAINLILKTKDAEYLRKFGTLKRLIYEQERIY